MKGQVEINRRIGAVAHRAIVDQRLRMDQPVLEAEAIDERLERRAGRAQRIRHIHPTGPLLVEIPGGTDPGEHLPGGVIDGEDGDRDVRPERAGPSAREFLEARLPGAVDGQADLGTPRQGRHGIVGGMGRERRHGRSCRRDRLGLRLRDFRRSEEAGSRHPVEDAVAGAACGFDGAVGPPRLRRLRQRHQQCRFAEGEPPGLLAEIGERGRTNAFDVAAIGRHAEIEREHLLLGEAALDLDGADDLAQLRRQ